MDIDDILVPTCLESQKHPEKDGNNGEKIRSGATLSSVPEGAKQIQESQSQDETLQMSSEILELEVDPAREKDFCKIPTEVARFTIDKPNNRTERTGVNSTTNNDKLEGQPSIKIPCQIKRKKYAKVATTISQIQTRRRYSFISKNILPFV